MINYFKNVAQEMKNVTWLTGEQTSKETITVITVSIIFCVVLRWRRLAIATRI
jgi:preprotein translocase subunit SecE